MVVAAAAAAAAAPAAPAATALDLVAVDVAVSAVILTVQVHW